MTYESLPFATRATLHEQLAQYLETVGAPLDTIAYHYGRSDNTGKQREYFRQAAQAALEISAFKTAVDYLARLDVVQPVAADAGTSSPALQRRLSISSNLQGVTLDYPQPLGKESATALPLNLSIDFLSNGQDLSVSLGQLGSMNISLAQGLVRNGLVFLGRRDEGLTVRRLDANAPGLELKWTRSGVFCR